jgi:hypothetical protein
MVLQPKIGAPKIGTETDRYSDDTSPMGESPAFRVEPRLRRERKQTICQNEQHPACQNEIGQMTQVPENIGAGEGNRTLVISLEVCCGCCAGERRSQQELDF